ncbi:hypothetical protein RHOFW510R12_14810 [Rhodanobacter sp. FW510-R12]
MLHFQLSQNRYPINSLVRLATGAGLDPDEIPQLEQALFRIRIPWFAPCGERCGDRTLRLGQASLAADQLQSPQQVSNGMRVVFQSLRDPACLAGYIAGFLGARDNGQDCLS